MSALSHLAKVGVKERRQLLEVPSVILGNFAFHENLRRTLAGKVKSRSFGKPEKPPRG